MRTIEFIKDFATKKKGDVINIDGPIASSLIKRKLAKLKTNKKQIVKK